MPISFRTLPWVLALHKPSSSHGNCPFSLQLSLRVKALKRQVDEAEEEIERLEGARKKAQRELEEQHELNEQLQNRIKALEKEAW